MEEFSHSYFRHQDNWKSKSQKGNDNLDYDNVRGDLYLLQENIYHMISNTEVFNHNTEMENIQNEMYFQRIRDAEKNCGN